MKDFGIRVSSNYVLYVLWGVAGKAPKVQEMGPEVSELQVS